MNYSKEELVNMVYAIGKVHGNCLLTSRMYKANNPDLQRYPNTKCFVNACSNQDSQIDIVGCAVRNPSISIREISDEISISKSVDHRTLKKNHFHPYHPKHHQFLSQQDCQRRLQFCEWATIKLQEDEQFFSKVLFTDESSFANIGPENRHNVHHYADHNPRLIRQNDHQHRFKVNVWAGICGEHVIGPHFLEGNLTGNKYFQFLQNDLRQLYRRIPADDRKWFQHHSAPAHSTLAVREYLNGLYPDKWIGRGGPIPWPPRSPDLSCLDFFLWGYIKNTVYETPPTDIENLRAKLRNAFLTVTAEMLRAVGRNFRQRIAICLENNGGHFEHLPVDY